MATLGQLQVGQTLYSISRQKMGNTTVSREVCHPVTITAIDPDGRWVEARWNGNPPRRYYPRQVQQWRVSRPKPKRTF